MKAFNLIRLTISVGIVTMLVSCASMVTQTQFKQYYGSGVVVGSGGTKRVLDGIDIWENGEPNYKFKILGFIDDDVLENQGAAPGTLNILSVASAVSLSGREKRVVATAKQHGADAIVYVSSNRSFLNAGKYETNFRNQVKIVLVKYVDEVGYRLGESRERIESLLGKGEEVSVDKIGVKLEEKEQAGFKAILYDKEPTRVVIVFNLDKADLAIIAMPPAALNDPTITGLLRSFGQGKEWKKSPSIAAHLYSMEWIRVDGLYYAVCSPENGLFVVGNQQTLHLK